MRVSVATLVRVVFTHPDHGAEMLTLERQATLLGPAGAAHVRVRAQPFGGAVRLRAPAPLVALIGDISFDSQRSRAEADFRLLIRPAAWDAVRQFCLEHLAALDDLVLEADPARELAEEVADALGLTLRPEQYQLRPIGTIVEYPPTPTDNQRAPGLNTARIYRVFEARVTDAALAQAMLANSAHYSDEALRARAWADFSTGGRGRANAVLTLPLQQVTAAYLALAPAARTGPVRVDDHQLDGNVPALLDGVAVPSFQRL